MTDRIPPQNTDRSKSVDHAMRQADIVSRARLATPITATSGRDLLDARLPRPFGLGSAELD